jgi:hypothetical protein
VSAAAPAVPPTPNARRALGFHAHLRARGCNERDAARIAVLSLYLDCGSALGQIGRSWLVPRTGGLLPDLVREALTAAGALLDPNLRDHRPVSRPSPFVEDALALASSSGGALATRHLVLSAFRQMRGESGARLVPTRLLLDLAGGDRVLANALYDQVVDNPALDEDPPSRGLARASDGGAVAGVGSWESADPGGGLVTVFVRCPGGASSDAPSGEPLLAFAEARTTDGLIVACRGAGVPREAAWFTVSGPAPAPLRAGTRAIGAADLAALARGARWVVTPAAGEPT